MMDLNAAILLELRQVRAEQAELREDVRHLARRLLDRDDRRIGEALLPLLLDLAEGQTFTGPSLAAKTLNNRSAEGEAVRSYLADCGSVKAFGKLLARLDGVALAGCRLVPRGERRDGRAWQVVRVSCAGNPQE